jgi:hypothetical protein
MAANNILELVEGIEEYYPTEWLNDLRDWLLDREDDELVEIMRGTASVLAYRIAGDRPSPEVFRDSLKKIAKAFLKSVRSSV